MSTGAKAGVDHWLLDLALAIDRKTISTLLIDHDRSHLILISLSAASHVLCTATYIPAIVL